MSIVVVTRIPGRACDLISVSKFLDCWRVLRQLAAHEDEKLDSAILVRIDILGS